MNSGGQGSSVEDVATVFVEVVGNVRGKAAQPIGLIVLHQRMVVKVESTFVAFSELLLHGCYILVFGPRLVDGPVGVLKSELKAAAFEVGVQGSDALINIVRLSSNVSAHDQKYEN